LEIKVGITCNGVGSNDKPYENLDALIPIDPLSPNFDGGFK